MAKKEQLNDYVAVLCRKREHREVELFKFMQHKNKEEVYHSAAELFPSWKVKAVIKLNDEDFTE